MGESPSTVLQLKKREGNVWTTSAAGENPGGRDGLAPRQKEKNHFLKGKRHKSTERGLTV